MTVGIKIVIKCLNKGITNREYMMFRYPEFRRDITIDNYHGIAVADPYRWLETPNSDETIDFIAKQNAITSPFINSCQYKASINRELTKLWNYPKVSPPYLHGNKYYQFKNSGLQNQSVMYVFDELNGEGRVFLDPNTFSEDGTVALTNTSFTLNGETVAYGVSESGSDWIEIRFRSTVTGADYPDVLKKVKYSFLSWAHDHESCFYAAYLDQEGRTDGSETDSSTNQKLYYHRLGTSQSEDIVVVEFEDPEIRSQTIVSDCGNYLVLTPVKGCKTNLLYVCNLKDTVITGKLPVTRIVSEFISDFEYIANNGSKFIFMTNQGAPNYHIIEIDFERSSEENWRVIVGEHPKDVLDWAKPINTNFILACYIRDVKDTLSLYTMKDGLKICEFKLDVGSISGFSGKRKHTVMFFGFTSFLTPTVIYIVDFAKFPITAVKWYETVLPDFDPNKFESRQIFYTSLDGTQIPMFIVNKKGLRRDGNSPCLLYGYGGFNVSVGPTFSASKIVFMDKFNGVFAVANIRGGGEYGEMWHNAGRFEFKQNVFDDFNQAACYLIGQKYTSPKKLTIQGGSNGGLLVAACINQAPELYGCALCLVGVLDMLRYHKFTIGYSWKSDYGCSDDPEQFQYLYAYSPLHNVRKPIETEQYPATLLLTADHDDRVVPLHSYKFIAELQYKIGRLYSQTNPLMIRIDTKSGHGVGKPTCKVIEEQTEMLCFMQKSLHLTYTN